MREEQGNRVKIDGNETGFGKAVIGAVMLSISAVLFSIVYVCVLVNSLKHSVGTLFAMGGLAVLYVITAYLLQRKQLSWKYLFQMLAIPMVILQLVSSVFLSVEYNTWDVGVVHTNALAIINGTVVDWPYFAYYPNNNAILMLITAIYRISKAIWGSMSVYFTILANVIAVDIAICFTMKTVGIVSGEDAKYKTGIACALFAPLYLYIPIAYTDTFCLPFISAVVYLIIKLQRITINKIIRKKVLFQYFVAGFILYFGIKIKASLFIVLVASVVVLFLWNKGRIFFIRFLSFVLGLFIGLAAYSGLEANFIRVSDEMYDLYKTPFTHWIMMGASGSGNYNSSDVGFTRSFDSYEGRLKATSEELGRRIQSMGFKGAIAQCFKKAIHYGWNYGTYYAERYLGDLGDMPVYRNIIHEFILTGGRYHSLFYCYTQGYYLLISGLFLLGMIRHLLSKRINLNELYLQISMTGFLCFYMIWETHPRYMLQTSLILVALSMISLQNLFKDRPACETVPVSRRLAEKCYGMDEKFHKYFKKM